MGVKKANTIQETFNRWNQTFSKNEDYSDFVVKINNNEYCKVEGKLHLLFELCERNGYLYRWGEPKIESIVINGRQGVIYKSHLQILDKDEKVLYEAYGVAKEFWDSSDINAEYAIEVAETSSMGRCLSFVGVNVGGKIDSAERMNQAINRSEKRQSNGYNAPQPRKYVPDITVGETSNNGQDYFQEPDLSTYVPDDIPYEQPSMNGFLNQAQKSQPAKPKPLPNKKVSIETILELANSQIEQLGQNKYHEILSELEISEEQLQTDIRAAIAFSKRASMELNYGED